MQVRGNLAADAQERTSQKSGKPFYTFRLGETQGKDPYKTTTWFNVSYFGGKPEVIAKLKKGAYVEVIGRIEGRKYARTVDGVEVIEVSLDITSGLIVFPEKATGSSSGNTTSQKTVDDEEDFLGDL